MALRFTKHESEATITIERLSSLLGTNEKGNVTFASLPRVQIATDILATFIEFSPQIVERQRRQITYRAVLDAKRDGHLAAKAILANAEQQQRVYLRKPVQKFVLLGSASFQFAKELRSVRLNNSILTFSPRRPKDFPLPDGGSLIMKDDTPAHYCYVKAHVVARDPHEAADVGFEQIDLLRAIWNFRFNLGSGFRMTFDSIGHKPVNRIIPGPFYTLHYPDGKLALEGEWWHVPSIPGVHVDRLNYEDLRRFEAVMRRRIAGCKFNDRLISFLVRYARALDEPDMSNAFLKLWSLLEEITGTERQFYDVTIRRASFVLHDPQYARIELGYLRDQRNHAVHKGRQLADPERAAYELKAYVEALLKFILAESKSFPTIHAFHSLLDLSPDPAVLQDRMSFHKLAYRLHRRAKHK